MISFTVEVELLTEVEVKAAHLNHLHFVLPLGQPAPLGRHLTVHFGEHVDQVIAIRAPLQHVYERVDEPAAVVGVAVRAEAWLRRPAHQEVLEGVTTSGQLPAVSLIPFCWMIDPAELVEEDLGAVGQLVREPVPDVRLEINKLMVQTLNLVPAALHAPVRSDEHHNNGSLTQALRILLHKLLYLGCLFVRVTLHVKMKLLQGGAKFFLIGNSFIAFIARERYVVDYERLTRFIQLVMIICK